MRGNGVPRDPAHPLRVRETGQGRSRVEGCFPRLVHGEELHPDLTPACAGALGRVRSRSTSEVRRGAHLRFAGGCRGGGGGSERVRVGVGDVARASPRSPSRPLTEAPNFVLARRLALKEPERPLLPLPPLRDKGEEPSRSEKGTLRLLRRDPHFHGKEGR